MTESQPAKKKGGYTYGRRAANRQLSNTAEESVLCIYHGHSLGRFSSASMRFDSHQACVRCVAAAREGRISLDIDTLVKRERKRALKFWSQVDIGAPDECWDWKGYCASSTGMPQFAWRRPGISSSTQHHPQRVAMWYSWGDLGFTGVKTTCGNRYCCNPFHLIPQGIGVFVDNDTYIENFELACQLHTLKQQVAEYQIELALEEQAKIVDQQLVDERADLVFAPDSEFSERLEAVMEDLLAGRNPGQASNLNLQLNEEEENPTDEF